MATQAAVIKLNGVAYTLAVNDGSGKLPPPYKVSEVPSHYDLDVRMERRVVWDLFGNILKNRDEGANDTGSTLPYSRQTKGGTGIWFSLGGDARLPHRYMAQRGIASATAILSAPVAIGDGTTYSYFAGAQHVYYLTGTISGVEQLALSKDFSLIAPSVNIVDAITYNGKLYFATTQLTNGVVDYSKAQVMWVWDQATGTTTWSQPVSGPGYAAGDTGKATSFAVIRNQLWRANGPNMWSWDGVAANWSSAYVIGETGTNITHLDVYRDALWIFKPEGIFSVDRSGQVYPLFPGFDTLGFNLRPLGQWRSDYYFASDVGMVWMVSGANVKSIGFDSAEPYPLGSGTYGILNATTRGLSLPNSLVVGFNQFGSAGTQAYFLSWNGKEWAPFRYFTNGQAAAVGITGGNQVPPVANAQFGLSGANACYFMANPTLDPFLSPTYDTTAQILYLPPDSGAIPDEDKVAERINILCDFATKGTFSMAYAFDDDIQTLVWHDLGVPQGASTAFQQWDFPAPLPKYKKLALKVTLTPAGNTASPILRNVILHYKQRGPQRRAYEIDVVAQDRGVGLSGRVDLRSTRKIIADLDAIRQTRQQIELIDLLGNVRQVYVDEVSEDLAVLKPPADPVLIVKLKLVEAATI